MSDEEQLKLAEAIWPSIDMKWLETRDELLMRVTAQIIYVNLPSRD